MSEMDVILFKHPVYSAEGTMISLVKPLSFHLKRIPLLPGHHLYPLAANKIRSARLDPSFTLYLRNISTSPSTDATSTPDALPPSDVSTAPQTFPPSDHPHPSQPVDHLVS